jgi:hypothetical protein
VLLLLLLMQVELSDLCACNAPKLPYATANKRYAFGAEHRVDVAALLSGSDRQSRSTTEFGSNPATVIHLNVTEALPRASGEVGPEQA